MDLKKLNIDEIQAGYKQRKFSPRELVSSYLDRIKKDKLNAFISVNDNALEQADIASRMLKSGRSTALTGVPMAIKDTIMVAGSRCTAGSKILESYQAPYSATVIERLLDQGVVILGKTNCDEFAMGASNENSAYGPVKNPIDHSLVPGGSSGGSAAAIAGDLAPVALGSDTGGSIRQPAAFCGVVGVKPSYGRVSRYGLIAMASSLDQIGPMANKVVDCARLLRVMAGQDKYDATASDRVVPDYTKINTKSVKKLRIGLPEQYFKGAIDPEIKTAIIQQVDELKNNGFDVQTVSLPLTEYALAAYYILVPAEVSSNLARYDGIIYGSKGKQSQNLDEWYKHVRSQGFGAETKRRIILGTFILSAGYYDAYYKQAQKVRRLIIDEYAKVFQKVDCLVTPATPTPAFKLGAKTKDPLEMYLSDVFTVAANIAGICGLTLPVARTKKGLPIGLQILAPAWQEERLFNLGTYIETKII